MNRILFGACLLAALVACEAANAAAKHHRRLQATANVSLSIPSALRDPCADPYVVCWAGTYIGRDPDPQVRARMLWDFQAGTASQ